MSKANVLIVDDNEMERYILSRQLKSIGIDSISQCVDGFEAITFFENYAQQAGTSLANTLPQIIFLDINMPIIDGFEFLEKFEVLRKAHDFSACQVFMYSSSSDEKYKLKANQYSCVTEFLIKGETPLSDIEEKISLAIY